MPSQTKNAGDLQKVIDQLDVPTSSPLDAGLMDDILSSEPFISVPDLFNIRTLTTPGTQITPPRYIYRSATLHKLEAAGQDKLRDLGIKKIFDLRARYEVEREPTSPMSGVENIWVEPHALIGWNNFVNVIKPDAQQSNSDDKEDDLPSLEIMYTRILRSHKDVYKGVFEHIRDHPDQPFLFHCYGGKDRTGILGALILQLAGASDLEIMYDYILTRAGLEPVLSDVRAHPEKYAHVFDVTDPRKAAISETRAETIIAFLRNLQREYGGASGYLGQVIGFSNTDIEKIRSNLRAPKAGL